MRLARNISSSHNATGIICRVITLRAAFLPAVLKSELAACKALARAAALQPAHSTTQARLQHGCRVITPKHLQRSAQRLRYSQHHPCGSMKTALVTLTLALAPGAVEAQSTGRRAHRDAVDWPSRAKAVRGALKDSFRAYEKDASGFDDLAPVSRRGVNWLHSRATLVDALDSLYVVGLREDYERAVTEVLRPTLVGEPPFWQSVSVFEYHIRVVGGLLGAF